MKTSEEMSKSVMEKVRAYEVHKAAVRKRVTAVSVTAAALAVCIFTGAAVTGNLRLGAAKSADNAVREEYDIEYGGGVDYEADATESIEHAGEYSASDSKTNSKDANGAGSIVYLTYAEFNAVLPENSPVKDLEGRDFEISECSAQFREGTEKTRLTSDLINAFADFEKDGTQGMIYCDFAFDGSLEEYAASKPLSFPDQKKLRIDGTEVIYSPDGDGGYIALFEYGGALYRINAGAGSPDKLQTLLTEIING